MESGHFRGAGRPLAQTAGIALVTALLVACGGGGGGGGGGTSSTGTGTGTGTGTLGPGGGLGTCPATRDTSATAFTLGVCDTVSATGAEQHDVGFKDVSSSVTINDFAAKRYTLNLPASIGSPVALSQENRCLNALGSQVGLVLEEPVRAAAGQARSLVQSFTQGTTGTDAQDATCPNRPARSAALPLNLVDFGAWERFVGGAAPFELYYGGWYAPRAGAPIRPAVNVVFDGNGANRTGAGGISVGYLFTAVSFFGMSGTLSNVSYDAATSTITGTLSNFQYSRSARPVAANAAMTSARFTATVAPNGTFTGTLTGTGTLTPEGQSSTAAAVTGLVEGVIVGDQSGFELAARYQASLTATGLSLPSARTAGSFATAQ